MGIPEDWVAIRSIWNEFQKLGSPESFAWLPSTDLDSETSDVLVKTSTRPALSTPRNNTVNCFNMTTEISKIDTADTFRNDRQKTFKHTVNSVADRSMKKTYTSALLKRKMRKYEAMLKVALMRERSTITSCEELSELQENELCADSIDVPVDKVVPRQTTITRDNINEHLLQNKQPQHLVMKNRSKSDINMSATSQSKDIEVSRSENALPNAIGSSINNVDSLKTPSNVFLNKSQFVTKNNKSNNSIKNLSSSSENSAINKSHIAYKNKITSENLSPKIRENISTKVVSSETSGLSVSNQSQSSKSNSSDKNILKHRSAVSKVSVNTSKNITPSMTSSEELRTGLAKKFSKHRDSVSLVLDKNYSELCTNESVSCNSSDIVDVDSYLANINSVVISYHHSNLINNSSEISAKNALIRVENVSRSEKTSSKTDSSINTPEEHHPESSSEDSILIRPPLVHESSENDSIFSFNYKKSENKGKQKVVTADLPQSADNQELNQIIQNVMSGFESSDDVNEQNSNLINKTATKNVEIPKAVKNLNQIPKEKINALNSETPGEEDLIQINKITESSNKKNSFLFESSNSEEDEDSHVIITTNAIVHSAVKASVKNGHTSSNINKSGSKENRKAIGKKSNKKRNNHEKGKYITKY